MKRLETLDIVKYVACLFVIMIHMDLPEHSEYVLQPLLTTAVPIFFMITGFFYSNVLKAGKAKKQLKKIAVLALVANGVHIGWRLVKCVIGGESVAAFAAEIVEPASLINLVVFNQPVWRTSIWYINALLVVLLLFYVVRKSEDMRRFYPLIPVLLAGNLLLGSYSFLWPLDEPLLLCYSRNFLFCGVPYFLLGNYVYTNRDRISRFFGKWPLALLFWGIGSVEMLCLKRAGLLYHQDHLLSTAFLALTFFCLCVKIESDVGVFGRKIAELGRNHCFTIYVLHSIVIELLYKIVNKIDSFVPFASDVFGYVGPLIVLFVTTLLACAIGCLRKRMRPKRNS